MAWPKIGVYCNVLKFGGLLSWVMYVKIIHESFIPSLLEYS